MLPRHRKAVNIRYQKKINIKMGDSQIQNNVKHKVFLDQMMAKTSQTFSIWRNPFFFESSLLHFQVGSKVMTGIHLI
jgi:hypothetical protein